MILPKTVKINQELNIHLDGYEVLAAELIPSGKIDNNLPIDIRYSINNEGLMIYAKSGMIETINSVNSKQLGKINFKGTNAEIKYH